MHAPLTIKQLAVLRFIRDCIEKTGFAPTVREIGCKFGINSPNGVTCHLHALEEKGCIERTQGLSRAIKVLVNPGRTPEQDLQLRTLETILAMTVDDCEGPTMQELAQKLGIRHQELMPVLAELKQSGNLTWDPYIPRSLKINRNRMLVTFSIEPAVA